VRFKKLMPVVVVELHLKCAAEKLSNITKIRHTQSKSQFRKRISWQINNIEPIWYNEWVVEEHNTNNHWKWFGCVPNSIQIEKTDDISGHVGLTYSKADVKI
jgi:hypothetical protein